MTTTTKQLPTQLTTRPTSPQPPTSRAAWRSEAAVSFERIVAFDLQGLWFVCPECDFEQPAVLDLGTRFEEIDRCADCGVVLAA